MAQTISPLTTKPPLAAKVAVLRYGKVRALYKLKEGWQCFLCAYPKGVGAALCGKVRDSNPKDGTTPVQVAVIKAHTSIEAIVLKLI